MPRQSRIDTTGALHHIIARGIERRKIFEDDQDRYDFMKNLGLILKQTETACFAWSLMSNHFHLLLRTGLSPIATVMRRLLSGHAIRYNRRHQRRGHLFQNRYKSILCQEERYLLELVRYIHLNPFRAKLVADMRQLDRYPFSGHGVILGKHEQHWQNVEEVLLHFGKRIASARQRYRGFIIAGIDEGRRDDLTGGGLIRSAGGWSAVRDLRESKVHIKSDERILGESDFVSEVLDKSLESFDKRYELKSRGVDVDFIAKRVSILLNIPEENIWCEGKMKEIVRARSLLCFWAVRELGMSMAAMARRLNISIVAVSKSVARGAEIVKKDGFTLA